MAEIVPSSPGPDYAQNQGILPGAWDDRVLFWNAKLPFLVEAVFDDLSIESPPADLEEASRLLLVPGGGLEDP